MDVAGAKHLQFRIEQQRHWRQADAVRAGEQTSCDPDLDTLSDLGHRVRAYGSERVTMTVEGEAVMVERRLCKRLVGRWWQPVVEEVVIE